jgi:Restriction endonuclease
MFEVAVAATLQAEGYETELTSSTNDWGVDVFATRGDERLAVQAKMYAGARPVNRRQVFELYGVAAYFGCTGAILATDGQLMSDAAAAAAKLGIRVLRPSEIGVGRDTSMPRAKPTAEPDFTTVWERSVMPLAGRSLTRPDGSSNTILKVDWGGVTRRTSGGNTQRIPIEIFKWAIERVLEVGLVTREEINQRYEGRASSGIVLILAEIPEFVVGGRPLTVCLRKPTQ